MANFIDTPGFQNPRDFQLVPDISPLANAISGMVNRRREEQKAEKKAQIEKLQKDFKTTGAQFLDLAGNKDFPSQRKQMAVWGQQAIRRGEDPTLYTDALNITDRDEFNTFLLSTARRAMDADKAIAAGFKQKETIEAEQRKEAAQIRKEQRKAAGGGGEAIPAELQTFQTIIKDFSPEEKEKARRVKTGLSPRATGSADQTILQLGIGEDIGKLKSSIRQREKFGEMTGSSRAKMIDKGFDRIVKIDKGINNIDKAIGLLEGGAQTGAVDRFLPSFRAATVELQQVADELALDVIGGVTLGAISKDELDLAKQVALPQGLSPPELIEHLEKRKAAQAKVRAYFQEQIDFLDRGGTVAGFLREKKRQPGQASDVGREAITGPDQSAPAVRFDRQGNRI